MPSLFSSPSFQYQLCTFGQPLKPLAQFVLYAIVVGDGDVEAREKGGNGKEFSGKTIHATKNNPITRTPTVRMRFSFLLLLSVHKTTKPPMNGKIDSRLLLVGCRTQSTMATTIMTNQTACCQVYFGRGSPLGAGLDELSSPSGLPLDSGEGWTGGALPQRRDQAARPIFA